MKEIIDRWFNNEDFRKECIKKLDCRLDDWQTEFEKWRTKDFINNPPEILKYITLVYYGNKYNLKYLVETGSYECHCPYYCSDNFEHIYTIEIDQMLYLRCRKFLNTYDKNNVTIYLGNSTNILPRIVSYLNEPALFWLDAHMVYNSPLMCELEIIFESKVKGHVILVDDVRLLSNYNISLEEIEKLAKANQYSYESLYDSVRLTPNVKN